MGLRWTILATLELVPLGGVLTREVFGSAAGGHDNNVMDFGKETPMRMSKQAPAPPDIPQGCLFDQWPIDFLVSTKSERLS